ncbi:MAG: rhodanese-like domain-containing protein [Fusobacteriaceae bacterium]
MPNKTITANELSENKVKYFIIDVRANEQFLTNNIKGSINIPLYEIKQNIDNIPKDKVVVTYCNGGTSGGIAATILQEHEFKVLNLEGGFSNYKSKERN